MMKQSTFLLLWCFYLSFLGQAQEVELMVLGIAQDAGAPQIQCKKNCCKNRWETHKKEMVSALGLVDKDQQALFLFDATPDIGDQLQTAEAAFDAALKGIFLTHAHIGHYSGLMYLGKEALGGQKIPVYAMQRMRKYLAQNGPWSQLVHDENILLKSLQDEEPIQLASALHITPLKVPHRDEYSETVGYRITGPEKSALFIPDIDKWNKWEKDIAAEVAKVDFAFLDATFFDGKELGNRDMSLIPHPFVEESIKYFNALSAEEKGKIYFIHLNHTNPLLDKNSAAYKKVINKGFNVAETGQIFSL